MGATERAVKKTKSKDVAAKTEKVEPVKPAQTAAKETKADTKPIKNRQVRFLVALTKAGGSLARTELAGKAEIDPTALGNQVGYLDPKINLRTVHAGNLLNRGFVRFAEADGVTTVAITAAGTKALADATGKPVAPKGGAK